MTIKTWGRVAFPALALALASCGAPQAAPPLQPTTTEPAAAAPELSVPSAGGPATPADRRLLAQASVSKGIPTTARCYTLSTERVVFKYFRVDSDNRSDWDAKANSIAETCDNGSRVWDDQWYYYTLSPSRTDNVLLVWKNIDRHEYGYLLIKNTPSLWLVYSNSGGPWVVKNDSRLTRTWHSDGKKIDIDVFNPNNTGDWTANDIWVSFGY